jgi:hypothetical protein
MVRLSPDAAEGQSLVVVGIGRLTREGDARMSRVAIRASVVS